MVGSFVVLLFVIEIVNTVLLHSLNGMFGLRPRSLDGILDILTFPLLHANLAHLLSNALPLMIFGFLVFLSGLRVFVTALASSWLGSGAAVWLIGLNLTVGASGLVFGLFAFLLVRGFFNRSWWQILLSVVLFMAYGGILFGILPTVAGFVSWQAHLGGAVGGVVAALLLSTRRAVPLRAGHRNQPTTTPALPLKGRAGVVVPVRCIPVSAREGLGGDDLDRDDLAVRGGVAERLALLVADDGRAQRGLLAEDVEIGIAGDFAGAEQERLFVAGNPGHDEHSGLHDSVVRRGLADVGVPEQRGELADAGFDLALLLLGGVVAAVLLEVALLAGSLDLLDDFRPARAGKVVQLCLQAVKSFLGKPSCSCAVGGRHGLLLFVVKQAKTPPRWPLFRLSNQLSGGKVLIHCSQSCG